MRSLLLMFAVALVAPATAAKAHYACTDTAQCPAGSVCYGGGCVQPAQPYAQPQPYPQPYLQPQPYPQPQSYTQPQSYPQPYPAPAYAPTSAPAPTPRTVSRPNLGMIIPGIALLAAGWIANGFVGLFAGYDLWGSSDSDEWDTFRWMAWVPAIGPWVQLGLKPGSLGDDDWALWLIIDGLLQTAGLTLVIVGAATPQTRTEYAGASSRSLALALVPHVTPGSAGLSLVGTF